MCIMQLFVNINLHILWTNVLLLWHYYNYNQKNFDHTSWRNSEYNKMFTSEDEGFYRNEPASS